MPPFWQTLFNKDKTKIKDKGSDKDSQPARTSPAASGSSKANASSPPISTGRGGHFPDFDYGYDEGGVPDLDLEIPATLRPQVTRDDFEPLGILGRGSFATVILVRSKLPQSPLGSRSGGLFSKPGSLKTSGGLSSSVKSNKEGKLGGGGGGGPTTAPCGFGTNKDLYAMKIIAKRRLLDSKRMKDVFTERDVLSKSSHPYLLRLHFTFQSEHKLFFVMDYMPGGDIRQLINSYRRRREPMPYEMARLFAAEVTLALTHLHDHGILYRDLKPENILLCDEGHCALADFGLSKDFGDLWLDEDEEIMRLKDKIPSMRATSFVGSPLYVAPEVLLREKYTKPIDFWGLGILIFTLLFGAEPFRGSNAKEIFDKILSSDVRFPTSMTTTPEAMDIIVRLLKKDPHQRLGAPEIFAHPFFKGLDFSAIMKQRVAPQGWVPPPPLPILTSQTSESENNPLNSPQHLVPPTVGQPLQQPVATRGRGFSEIYTPDHHAAQVRGSQQVFFENFSWTNVEHLYAISGETHVMLSDGTIMNRVSTRTDSTGSDFYDAPLPPTTPRSDVQHSFSDMPSSDILLLGGDSYRTQQQQHQQMQQQIQQQQMQSHHRRVGSNHRFSGNYSNHGHQHHNPADASSLPASGRNLGGSSSSPPLAKPNPRAPGANRAGSPPQRGSTNSNGLPPIPHSPNKGPMGKSQSTGSFFAPPPSEGFDSNLNLSL